MIWNRFKDKLPKCNSHIFISFDNLISGLILFDNDMKKFIKSLPDFDYFCDIVFFTDNPKEEKIKSLSKDHYWCYPSTINFPIKNESK